MTQYYDIQSQLADLDTKGYTPRVIATYTRASDSTNYSVGDLIGNSTTAASVVPMSFTVARVTGGTGRITGCRAVVTAASGTVVLPAFDLLLFKPETTAIPFTAGAYPADNAALVVSSTAMQHLTAVFSFTANAWRNSAGGSSAAGLSLYQTAILSPARTATFNLTSSGGQVLLAIMQAQNTWAPGSVAQQFDFYLDVAQD